MPDLYAQVLHGIIVRHGRSVCEEPRKLKALLADYLGKHPGQHDQPINVLILALENRVVQDLLVSDPADMVQRRIAERFKSSLGVTEQAAAWAVATWSAALAPQVVPAATAQPLVTLEPLAIIGGSDLKPPSTVVGAATDTEGASSPGQFRSMTEAAARFVRTAPFPRKALGLLLGGTAGVLLLGILWLAWRGESKPTIAQPAETTPQVVPDDWKVIFRSDNPSLWNDDINDKKHLAVALTLVTDDIRYLRLTDMTSKEFVIVPMSKDRLGKRSDDGRYGWDGSNDPSWGGRHLGIYLSIWPASNRGDVCVSSRPFFRGWGFGHHQHINDRQCFSWEGRPIDRTVFEIAVKAQELTAAEAKKLLKAGVPRQQEIPLMQNLYAQTLRQIIVQHGRSVCEDPRKLKALLSDYLGKLPGQHDQPINVLILALENRVVQDLLVSDALPANVTQRRIADRLKSSLGLTEQMASWAVATWNTALLQQPAAANAPAPALVSSAAGVKPNILPLAGTNQVTEGAASMKQFRSMTLAATGLVRNAVTAPFWRKPLGMFFGGGIAGVLAMLALILFFRSGGAASTTTPTQASAPEPPPPPPDTWKVIFRSADPSLWNDDINRGPDQFGMALDLVPSDIRFLRLTNMSNKEFVIIEMTKDRLGKQSDDGRVGWDGRNAFDSDAYHLGIFYKIWGVGGGETLISWPGHRGWGFGHGAFVNGRQFYAWEGKNIDKTVFEIAVKAEPLTDAEAKKLLKVGIVRQ